MRIILLLPCFAFLFILTNKLDAQVKPPVTTQTIDLSGEWLFQTDPTDIGVTQKWFNKQLADKVKLPGSMATNNKGDEITIHTKWTGSIFDSSWFLKNEYAKYRQPGNIKVPFWLQPVKYYVGAAWYQKEVTVPVTWQKKHIELFIERSHWETTVWIDGQETGMQNSLATAQVFDLSKLAVPGKHTLTICVDNRIKDINPGPNSHSISDHTQTNWNGMIGKLVLRSRPALLINDVRLFPDVKNKQVVAKLKIENGSGAKQATISLMATSENKLAAPLKPLIKTIALTDTTTEVEIIYPMGAKPLLWNEFTPNIYSMKVSLQQTGAAKDEKNVLFGMRSFTTIGSRFAVNDKLTFLRGTLECAIFPLTGYPPTDVSSWMKIFHVAKSYGLNHMRFHSWCPPDAAFEAADRSGFYLQIECSSWANWGTSLGNGLPIDQYIYDESEHIVKDYGNHPSFCMLAYGNEPSGKNYVAYLTQFVNYWKKKDNRRLYTTGAGWPNVADNDYQSASEPRIQHWGEGLKSIINSQQPKTDYDWRESIARWSMPVVSHEIGQWCVYPDFKEIKKYTGILQAKNFEIFQETLAKDGMAQLADSFLLASGKLQALCYKADIEAALRTPSFGGFQLLDLHDFPGQGTALVGVLNAFWEDKGYITAKEYSRFCNATVPLARFPKMIYRNNETLAVPVEIAHFSNTALTNVVPAWKITDQTGKVLFKGELPKTTIQPGNGIKLGAINQALATITAATKLILTVRVDRYENNWEFFVYPATLSRSRSDFMITQELDQSAMDALANGGKVLWTLKKGTVGFEKGRDVEIGFSSIFWNTAWTHGQAPHTLGILCDPSHPAFKDFPTDYYSNWQWWDAMTHSNAIILDSVAKGLQPIVRVIDDWVTNRSLGLIFECKVGKGKLLVSGIDLIEEINSRPSAKQMLYSLEKYMGSEKFNPTIEVEPGKIMSLLQ
ncbi:MAG: sugar-binding domain-containing protein [Chitinophagaceae bacterium]